MLLKKIDSRYLPHMHLNSIKAYCITLNPFNLTRAIPTKKAIEKLGFSCEFVEGVNIKNRPLDEFSDILSHRAYLELKNGRKVHEALSGMGSLGCYLAHLKLWKKCAESQEPMAIFEDDIGFTEDAAQKLPALLDDAEKHNFGVLRLSYVPWKEGPTASNLLKRPLLGVSCAAYIIKPEAARTIVKHAYPIEMHCDFYLDALGKKGLIEQYYPSERMIFFRVQDSTIGHSPIQFCKVDSPFSHWILLLFLFIFFSCTMIMLYRVKQSCMI